MFKRLPRLFLVLTVSLAAAAAQATLVFDYSVSKSYGSKPTAGWGHNTDRFHSINALFASAYANNERSGGFSLVINQRNNSKRDKAQILMPFGDLLVNQKIRKGAHLISFNKQISVWLQPNKNARFHYNSGTVKSWAIAKRKLRNGKGTNDKRIVSVPEPGTLALLAAGIAGLGISRRSERNVSAVAKR